MEYIVKCSYCGVTYFVNSEGNNANFSCDSCGAVGGKNDVVEAIDSKYKTISNGKDDDAHFEYYLNAAKQGDMIAQFKIGVYYDKGKGVKQDLEEAVNWYSKAAAQGHEKAQAKLIECGNIL